MSVTIKLRLPVPEGRPGDVVQVSNERAAVLVDRRYAIHVSGGDVSPDYVADATEVAEVTAEETGASSAPETELPAVSDLKAEWVKAAESLGIDLQREDGSDKSKDELIEEVGAAAGA